MTEDMQNASQQHARVFSRVPHSDGPRSYVKNQFCFRDAAYNYTSGVAREGLGG